MMLQTGILLAFACAFATNLGFLYKYRGARVAPAVDMRHPVRSAVALWSSKWFAIGMLVAIGAFGLHVAAMALAPLSVVQAVLAGGVVLLAVMAERLFGYEVGRRQWLGVGFTALGLVLLVATLPHSGDSHSQFSLSGMIAFEGALVGAGGLLIVGPRIGGEAHQHGIMLAAAAGILFGVSDIAIKALTGLVGTAGMAGLVSPWLVVTVLASVAAFYSSARALQVGQAVPVIATTGTAANVATIGGGIVVFGDPMPGDPLGVVVQLLAFVVICVAAALTPAPVRAAEAVS